MDESLDAIMALLKCEEPVTMKTDWFELREARLHLAPYTDPHFPIAVASTITPSGMIAAGKHGLGVLSLGAGLPGGPEALAKQWKIAEETAAKHGKDRPRRSGASSSTCTSPRTTSRRCARSSRRAPRDHHLLRGDARPPAGPRRRSAARGREDGHHAGRLARHRGQGHRAAARAERGGFGGVLFRAHEWANREQTLRELRAVRALRDAALPGLARHHRDSNEWARDNRKTIFSPNVEAVRQAFTDAGREVPEEFRNRTSGARDVAND